MRAFVLSAARVADALCLCVGMDDACASRDARGAPGQRKVDFLRAKAGWTIHLTKTPCGRPRPIGDREPATCAGRSLLDACASVRAGFASSKACTTGLSSGREVRRRNSSLELPRISTSRWRQRLPYISKRDETCEAASGLVKTVSAAARSNFLSRQFQGAHTRVAPCRKVVRFRQKGQASRSIAGKVSKV